VKAQLWSEIVIDAPLWRAWTVLANTRRYPDWNPFIRRLEGPLEPGERLDASVRIRPERTVHFKALLIRVLGEREIRWIGRAGPGGLFDAEHSLALEAEPADRTRLIHRATVSGLLVPFVWPFLKKPLRADFAAMNEAFRVKVETGRDNARMIGSESGARSSS
jgi:hypothetical protein